ANDRTGVGAITGAISGNVILFEFDERLTYDGFKETAGAAGLGPLVQKIEDGYCEDSPSGVGHCLIRVEQVNGNKKLASRPKRPDEMKDGRDKVKTLIETREEGGYVILAPSYGSVHETGRPYVLRSGSFATIATLTVDEQDQLWALARMFDEMLDKVP